MHSTDDPGDTPIQVINERIRARVTAHLTSTGKSERQLAIESGMGQSTLNRFMSHKTESLTLENLTGLAEALGLPVDVVIADPTAPDIRFLKQDVGGSPLYRVEEARATLKAMEELPPDMFQAVADFVRKLAGTKF